jgi:hypothetical protein
MKRTNSLRSNGRYNLSACSSIRSSMDETPSVRAQVLRYSRSNSLSRPGFPLQTRYERAGHHVVDPEVTVDIGDFLQQFLL